MSYVVSPSRPHAPGFVHAPARGREPSVSVDEGNTTAGNTTAGLGGQHRPDERRARKTSHETQTGNEDTFEEMDRTAEVSLSVRTNDESGVGVSGVATTADRRSDDKTRYLHGSASVKKRPFHKAHTTSALENVDVSVISNVSGYNSNNVCVSGGRLSITWVRDFAPSSTCVVWIPIFPGVGP